MYSQILGMQILQNSLNNYAVVLTNHQDYLLLSAALYEYKIMDGSLVKKEEDELPSVDDAVHYHMHPITYIETYPIRHGFDNYFQVNENQVNENIIQNNIENIYEIPYNIIENNIENIYENINEIHYNIIQNENIENIN